MPYTLTILTSAEFSEVRRKVCGEDNATEIPDTELSGFSVGGLAEETVKARVPDWATIKASGSTRDKALLYAAAIAAFAAVISPAHPPVRQQTFASVNTSYSTESAEARTARLWGECYRAIADISTQAASSAHLMAVKSIDYDALDAPHVYDGADIA
jgi:hypothetical protein